MKNGIVNIVLIDYQESKGENMAKGQEAKDNLIKKILNGTAGSDYIGEYDKKHYFWSSEKGEQIQVAISLTCPKNQVSVVNTDSDEIDFENIQAQPTTFTPAEITQEEKDKVKELMDKLGL